MRQGFWAINLVTLLSLAGCEAVTPNLPCSTPAPNDAVKAASAMLRSRAESRIGVTAAQSYFYAMGEEYFLCNGNIWVLSRPRTDRGVVGEPSWGDLGPVENFR